MGEPITVPGLDLEIGGQKPGFVAAIMEPFESIFGSLGMSTPLLRFLGVTAAAAGALYLFKPLTFFEYDGRSRPWSIWTMDGPDSDSTSTWVPWWLCAILAGLCFAVFV